MVTHVDLAKSLPSLELTEQTSKQLNWIVRENFVLDSALGTYGGAVLVLDTTSKKDLGIDLATDIILPGEIRRVQTEQIIHFCTRVIEENCPMEGHQAMYMLEFFSLPESIVAKPLGMQARSVASYLAKDNELSEQASVEVAAMLMSHAHECLQEVEKTKDSLPTGSESIN